MKILSNVKNQIKRNLFSQKNNILILGESGSGKSFLVNTYYEKCLLSRKLLIQSKKIDGSLQYYVSDNLAFSKVQNLAFLLENHDLIIIDELDGLLFELSTLRKQIFIRSLKKCLNEPQKTVIIANQRPLSTIDLIQIFDASDCSLREFAEIIVGRLNVMDIYDSYLKDFPDIEKCLNFDSAQRNFLFYNRQKKNKLVLEGIFGSKALVEKLNNERQKVE